MATASSGVTKWLAPPPILWKPSDLPVFSGRTEEEISGGADGW